MPNTTTYGVEPDCEQACTLLLHYAADLFKSPTAQFRATRLTCSGPGVLPMGFSPGQVRYGFNVTKEIDIKMFFGVKGFITRLVVLAVGQALVSLHSPRALQ